MERLLILLVVGILLSTSTLHNSRRNRSISRISGASVPVTLIPLLYLMKPKLRVSQNNLEFASDKWGEKLTEIIIVSNPISETILSGNWEVAPHVNDPPHTPYDHSWISFSPQKFEGDNVACEITVDTSKLVENEIYTRDIFLHSNSASEIEIMNIQVETGSVTKLEVSSVLMFFFSRFVVAVLIFYGFYLLQFHPVYILCAAISIGVYSLVNSLNKNIVKFIRTIGVLPIIIIVILPIFILVEGAPYGIKLEPENLLWLLLIAILIRVSYFLAWPYLLSLAETIKLIIPKNEIDELFSKIEKRLIYLFTIGLDFSLIITFKLFFEVISQPHCFTLGEILVSAIVAIAFLSATLIPLVYLLFKPARIFSKYRKAEPNLIKP